MTRLHRRYVLAPLLATALTASTSGGEEKVPKNKRGEEKWLVDRRLTVSPRAAPVPALRYRLFPQDSTRKPGNAVPIYLRLVHEQNDASRRRWHDTPKKWNELPLDRLPMDEVRKFLNDYHRFYRQFELGARRTSAEWNYTLDEGSIIGLVLPDLHAMRTFIPMLVLKARAEIADKDYIAAARTLETGFAMSRHTAEGPFLIPAVVAVAMASVCSDGVVEFVQQPDAPNLYWALTALPRPLICMRKGMEYEQRLPEMEFPELDGLDRPRTVGEWAALLKRLRTQFELMTKLDRESPRPKPTPEGSRPEDPAEKSPDLEPARTYLARRLGKEQAKRMPDAQVLVLYLIKSYHDFAGDFFKSGYLPYPQARPIAAAVRKRLNDLPNTEANRFTRWLLPSIDRAMTAQIRLERRIAALRAIEVLRLHAAADGGLPVKLSDVTAAPVPDDPGTGKPFGYRRDGRTATLTSRLPGQSAGAEGLRYRVMLRRD
jgi:hypothetical protein